MIDDGALNKAETRQTAVLFCDFREDMRISMDVYAEELSDALARYCGDELIAERYRPRVPTLVSTLPSSAINRMRIARFASYPAQARRNQGDVNHIIDHGYGHLLHVIDPARTVVTVHDLIPLLHWKGDIHGVRRRRRPWLSEVSFRALKRAARLIAVSETTKRDLVRYIRYDPARISVVYWGIHHRFRPYDEQRRSQFRSKLGLPGASAHVILIAGSAFYKNETTSLRVLMELNGRCRKPVMLARCGPPSTDWERAVDRTGMRGRVITVPYLPTGRMPELYNAVDCLLFPSWYEGFGLPPIEAMACGTPVVASNVASLVEVTADAAITARPDNVHDLSEGVRMLLENDERRLCYIDKGLRNAARFSWKRAARETLQVYRSILEEQNQKSSRREV